MRIVLGMSLLVLVPGSLVQPRIEKGLKSCRDSYGRF